MKSCVSAETLYELTTVTSPAVAPDGKSAAIVVTKWTSKNDYIANIYGLDIQKVVTFLNGHLGTISIFHQNGPQLGRLPISQTGLEKCKSMLNKAWRKLNS